MGSQLVALGKLQAQSSLKDKRSGLARVLRQKHINCLFTTGGTFATQPNQTSLQLRCFSLTKGTMRSQKQGTESVTCHFSKQGTRS